MDKVYEVVGNSIAWTIEKLGDSIVFIIKESFELLGKGIIELIKQISGCNEIFVIVAIVGMYFVIVGKKEIGTKITSGTIIAYIVSKGVKALC